jgi:hypothetical protein
MLTISVVVPVYRAEETRPELCRPLVAVVAEIAPVSEIIFVEGGGGGGGSWLIPQSTERHQNPLVDPDRPFEQQAAGWMMGMTWLVAPGTYG